MAQNKCNNGLSLKSNLLIGQLHLAQLYIELDLKKCTLEGISKEQEILMENTNKAKINGKW